MVNTGSAHTDLRISHNQPQQLTWRRKEVGVASSSLYIPFLWDLYHSYHETSCLGKVPAAAVSSLLNVSTFLLCLTALAALRADFNTTIWSARTLFSGLQICILLHWLVWIHIFDIRYFIELLPLVPIEVRYLLMILIKNVFSKSTPGDAYSGEPCILRFPQTSSTSQNSAKFETNRTH